MSDDRSLCGVCGAEMPPGEEMFNYHGYSGPCPITVPTNTTCAVSPPGQTIRTITLTGLPRRNHVDLATPAESAIRAAMVAVENAGADPRLTRAVTLLEQALGEVADFVDGVLR